MKSICLLGFGEVGAVLAQTLCDSVTTVVSIDKAFNDPASRAAKNLKSFKSIQGNVDAGEGLNDVELVISAVTAEQDIPSARAIAKYLPPNAWFLDLNSVSPATKISAAEITKAAGGRYVEGAIMSPIQPQGIASPILLGGPHAEAFLPVAKALGFTNTQYYDSEIGKAAASKMCRSVMIKGLESLLTESLISARYYGVEAEVISSLNNLMPGVDWQQHAAYMISRSLEHGARRAEEMREAQKTVKDAGLLGLMSAACASTQAWTADFNSKVNSRLLTEMLDEFREQL